MPITPRQFAELILMSQDIHEDSWESQHASYSIDYYNAALASCRQLGIAEDWAQPVALATAAAWNDTQAWANAQIAKG